MGLSQAVPFILEIRRKVKAGIGLIFSDIYDKILKNSRNKIVFEGCSWMKER